MREFQSFSKNTFVQGLRQHYVKLRENEKNLKLMISQNSSRGNGIEHVFFETKSCISLKEKWRTDAGGQREGNGMTKQQWELDRSNSPCQIQPRYGGWGLWRQDLKEKEAGFGDSQRRKEVKEKYFAGTNHRRNKASEDSHQPQNNQN